MRSFTFIAVLLLICVQHSMYAQAELGNDSKLERCEEIEMSQGVDILEVTTNNYLKGLSEKSNLARFVMNDADLQFWLGQFEFTEEVLAKISKEEFYNKLEGWAGEAGFNYMNALEGVDEVRVMDRMIQIDDTPGLRISRKANIILYLYQDGQLVNDLKITLVECMGQFKLIQAQ
ncbi:MAG: hypothetical protein GY751_11740 [Bacteroidetes bacterium]|nr:hypothetical protein [Bacteroidota bacterium]